MAVANMVPQLTQNEAFSFEGMMWDRYPGQCTYCFKEECVCLNVRVRPSLIISAGTELDATLDPLTTLRRKEVFEREFAEAVASATEKKPLSRLLLDLDSFKAVNDRFGHPFGDKVLAAVAGVLRKVMASYDGAAYRWGGEEFTALLPDRSEDEARACGERIRQETAQGVIDTPSGGEHTQTVSVGVRTFYGALGQPVSALSRELLDSVDRAMYKAKAQGRNRVVAAREAQTEKEKSE